MNPGPAPAEWLAAVSIYTKADLMRVGPVVAFRMVEQVGFTPSLNPCSDIVQFLRGEFYNLDFWSKVWP